MMRSLFLLTIVGLFLAGDVFASTEQGATIEAPSMDNSATAAAAASHELHYVDRDVQSRRKEWDVFSLMLMALGQRGCGEHLMLPGECHDHKECVSGGDNWEEMCKKLCDKKNHPGKKSYEKYCSYTPSSSTTTASSTSYEVNSASGNDAYNGNSTPQGVVFDGNLSAGFQFWMVAAAISVGMALVAVHIGQRREDLEDEDKSLLGAEVRGSVGRRVGAVSGLMDGVLGGKPSSSKQVELSGYQLEVAPTDSYESAMV